MKDAKGHGSNGRGGLSPGEQRVTDYGSRVLRAVGAMGIAAQHAIPISHLGKVIPARPAGDTNPFPTRTATIPFGRRK